MLSRASVRGDNLLERLFKILRPGPLRGTSGRLQRGLGGDVAQPLLALLGRDRGGGDVSASAIR